MKKNCPEKHKSTPCISRTLPFVLGLAVASPSPSTPLLRTKKRPKTPLIHSRKGSLPLQEEKSPLRNVLFRPRESTASSAFSRKRGSLLQPPGCQSLTTPWKHWLTELKITTAIQQANSIAMTLPAPLPVKTDTVLQPRKVVIRVPQAEGAHFSFGSRETEPSTSLDTEEVLWRLSETCGSSPQPTVMQPWRKYTGKRARKRRCKPGATFTLLPLPKRQI